MLSHTEGKLLVLDCREVGADYISISNGSVVIARIKSEVTGRPLTDEDLANARRLVACWNEHDALVHDNARLYQSLQCEMQGRLKAEQERDEAVEVLRELYECPDVTHSHVCNKVEAILAKHQKVNHEE